MQLVTYNILDFTFHTDPVKIDIPRIDALGFQGFAKFGGNLQTLTVLKLEYPPPASTIGKPDRN